LTATLTSERAPSGVFATLRATPVAVRYLLGGVFINQMGAFVQTFLVLYLTARGMSVDHAGLALTAYSAGAVLGSVLGGETTQRFGARVTIAGAMTASAAVLACVPWLGTPGRFAPLLVAIAVAGLVTQAYRPAAALLLAELMPGELRVLGFSMMRIALNGGAALSPLIAAALILTNWNLLFWLDAGTALAYAALAFALLPNSRAGQDTDNPAESAPAVRGTAAYRALLHDRGYLAFLASVLLGSIVYVQYTVALPLKIRADGHPPALYSAVLTTSALVLILCELKLTTYVKHWRPFTAGAGGTALMGLGLAGYGLPLHSTVLLLASTVLFVFGVMISGPTMFAYPSTFPPATRARYVAAHQAFFGLGLALGPTLGVLAWGALGNGVWWACGAVAAVAAICARVGIRPGATEDDSAESTEH
jgi:predicted MFS family arabinose efflux permease